MNVCYKINRSEKVGIINRLLVGKRPLGRTRHGWVDNIGMDLGEVGWDDVHWIGLA
jgi:hypothetical protein